MSLIVSNPFDLKPVTIDNMSYFTQFTMNIANSDIVDDNWFTDYFVWDINNKMQYCEINNNIILFNAPYTIKDGLVRAIHIIGYNDLSDTVDVILKHQDYLDAMLILSEDQILSFDHTKYRINSIEDMHEYIIDIHAIRGFEGPRFRQKRYKYLKFLREHNISIIYFDTDIDLDYAKISEALSIFCYQDNKSNQNISEEYVEELAIKKAVDYAKELSIRFHFLYIDNEMVGFHIYDVSNKKYAVGHFKKARRDIVGLSEYFDKLIFEDLCNSGVHYMNIMEDAGNNGLRYYKNTLCPIAKNRMFSIKLK